MDFSKKVIELRKAIRQFMQVHNNPHDTSKFNEIADQLNSLDQTLKGGRDVTPTPNNKIDASVGEKGTNKVDDVKVVQQLLNNHGASLKVDGDAGPSTIKAIKAFQAKLGTKNPDGRVDPNGFTWGHLTASSSNTTDNSSTTPTTNDTTPTTQTINKSVGKNGDNNVDDVKVVQQLLNDHGASLTVDGDAGPSTIKAIKAFQAKLGTKNPDGRVDPNGFTWGHLTQKAVKKNQETAKPTEKSNTTEETSSRSPETSTSSEETSSTSVTTTNIKGSVGKNGDNNIDDVKVVQQLLNNHGASLKVDGDAGPSTIKAIKNFQSIIGLPDFSGLIEPNSFTWEKLNKDKDDHRLDQQTVSTGDEPIPEELSVTSKITKSVGHKGANLPEDVLLVHKLLIKFNLKLEESSTVTVRLISAIKRFQKEYVGSRNPDGRIDPNGKTWNTLLGIGRIRGGIYKVAKKFDIEPAVILAIQAVESGGNGFLADGRPKILFEGHIFWRELKKAGKDPAALRPGNENIIYSKWTKANYKFGVKEYDRLALAEKIDKIAALKSASWGEFQIMGFNHASAGYSDVESFVEAMYKPGANQLGGLMGFLKDNNLLRHVRGESKNWAALAKGYNGPAYAENKYDIKLERAYERFSKILL
ncbi:N-acetylmuramidase domain-containing protein [Aureispira anguillae]|uniref:N-acetylmuramidase domain-containing protein n=1 Tax=Aureispira anguillae TaxID=2864201 RepID=A0A916DV19_9BACT|nr:N-acetylmuramidase domain-containing protein [Aureispira anguillae]BDS13272.1 N-acetylmuramidase domain-containing protein [Aureispira anguillae]